MAQLKRTSRQSARTDFEAESNPYQQNTPHLSRPRAHGEQGKPSKRLLTRPAREVELSGTGAPVCIRRLPWYGAVQPVGSHVEGEEGKRLRGRLGLLWRDATRRTRTRPSKTQL